jgi:hypothetical protein
MRRPNGRSTASSRRRHDQCSSRAFGWAPADRPPERLEDAREPGSLLEAGEGANGVMFMLRRPRGMTNRDVVMMPVNFDL